jgi:hypothetical protein
MIGRMGRFSAYDNGAKLCLVTEGSKPGPRQLFTGRNAEGLRIRRTHPQALHGVLVQFRNNGADEDFRADEVWAYADGYSDANATLVEGLQLDFACSKERAFKEGRRYIARRTLQTEVFEWTAPADARAATYGDRVLVRHIAGLIGEAEGRVRFRRWSGSLVAGVRLDGYVTMVAGKSYALDVRRADGVLRNLAVVTTPGRTRDLTFAAPLATTAAPEKGDLVAFGEADLVAEDLELADYDPQGTNVVRLRAVRYVGPELEAAETGPVPPFTPSISDRPRAPTPRLLGVRSSAQSVTVMFDLDPVRGALIESIAVRWRRTPVGAVGGGAGSRWTSLSPLPPQARSASTPPLENAQSAAGDAEAEYRVDLEIRSVLSNGDVSPPLLVLGQLAQDPVPTPENVTAVGVKRDAPDGTSIPAIALAATARIAGDVQDLVVQLSPAGAGTWTDSAASPLLAANPSGDLTDVLGGQSYDVRVAWRTAQNWLSDWVVVSGVAVPAGGLSVPGGPPDPQGQARSLRQTLSGGTTASSALFMDFPDAYAGGVWSFSIYALSMTAPSGTMGTWEIKEGNADDTGYATVASGTWEGRNFEPTEITFAGDRTGVVQATGTRRLRLYLSGSSYATTMQALTATYSPTA